MECGVQVFRLRLQNETALVENDHNVHEMGAIEYELVCQFLDEFVGS